MIPFFGRTDYPFIALFIVIFLRYFILALVAFIVFYKLLISQWASRKIQPRIPLTSDYLREFFYSLLASVIFSAIGYGVFFTPFIGYTQTYLNFQEYDIGYFIFSIFLMLVVHDTYFYWTHRLMHHPRVYRLVHLTHHLSTNPSPWAAFAFHPLEAVIEAGIIVLVPFLFPVHPMAIAIFLLIMMAYNVYGHLGFELFSSHFTNGLIGKWLNTSVSHNHHHAKVVDNYGLYFLFWDRLLGTYREGARKTVL